MFLNFILTVVLLQLTKSEGLLKDENFGRHIENSKKLLHFIELLNSEHENRIRSLNDQNFMKNLENKGQFSQYKKGVSSKIGENLQNILGMLQKNYDAKEKNKDMKSNPVIFINNPEVIEDYNKEDNLKDEAFSTQLRRQIDQLPIFSTSSSSSEESDDKRRNLKNVLQDIRRNSMLPSYDDIKNLVSSRRRSHKTSNRGIDKGENVEKFWKENTMKEKPQKKSDFAQAFDTNQQASRHKKDFRPRKHPVAFQSKPKIKLDSYKPKKDSYYQKREDYRSYGRTSIPVVGKQSVYEKK